MDFNSVEEKMNKTISVFEENLSEVRAGRKETGFLRIEFRFHMLLRFRILGTAGSETVRQRNTAVSAEC